MNPNILISTSAASCENYIAAVAASGGLPRPAYCPSWAEHWDGLLLCGGDDVDPACFGQENCGSTGLDPQRDRAELALISAFLSAGLPILGICRGLQVLNVALGGTLIQDIAPELHVFHTHDYKKSDRSHVIRAAEGSLLHTFYGPGFPVNSFHHQAVDAPGRDFVPTAWAESGLVEASELTGRPVLGVQFHPERMTGGRLRPDTVDGAPIFAWFMERCREARLTRGG